MNFALELLLAAKNREIHALEQLCQHIIFNLPNKFLITHC